MIALGTAPGTGQFFARTNWDTTALQKRWLNDVQFVIVQDTALFTSICCGVDE